MSSTPLAPVSLDNTLNGMDPQTLAEALAAMQAQQLAANTQQATDAASQAGQQYQQAAAAPSPDIGAAAAFIPTLLSNLASVIGQEPSYRENTQEGLKGQRATLLKNRADNLLALRDVWNQKADAAQKAGDLETEMKARMKTEQMSKLLEGMNQQRTHADKLAEEERAQANRIALEQERGRQSRIPNPNKEKGVGDNMDFLNQSVITTSRGRKILDASGMTPTDLTKAKKWAADNNVKLGTEKTMDKLRHVEAARTNLQAMANQSADILPKDAAGRLAASPGIKLSEIFQSNPERNAFKTWRMQAIQQLVAIAGGMGSGLRLNQAEIQQAVKSDIPTIYDTLPVAMQKINNVLDMLDRNEDPYLSQDWQKTPGTGEITPVNKATKAEALKAARTGDRKALRDLISNNPSLDNDPDILKVVQGAR